MKRVFFIIAMCLLMCGVDASAQFISSKKSSLKVRSGSGGVVTIVEDSSTMAAVARIEKDTKTPAKVSGYRFVIFHDSEQFADERATKALRKFRSTVKNVTSYINVESPTYRILVGDCFDQEDIAIIREKLEEDYPDAALSEEDIPLRLLLRVEGSNYLMIDRNGVVTGGVEFEETYFDAESDDNEEQESIVIETPTDYVQPTEASLIAKPEEEDTTIAKPLEKELTVIAKPVEEQEAQLIAKPVEEQEAAVIERPIEE